MKKEMAKAMKKIHLYCVTFENGDVEFRNGVDTRDVIRILKGEESGKRVLRIERA